MEGPGPRQRKRILRATALFCALGILLFPVPGRADAKPDEGELLVPPPMVEPESPDGSRCFTLRNAAPFTVMGSIISNYTKTLDGAKARQVSNFRLAPDGKKRFCTTGPYYPGPRLGLMIRTLVPVFSCYFVPQGVVDIHGEIHDDNTTKTWADCQ